MTGGDQREGLFVPGARIPQDVALRLQLAMIAGREPLDRFWEIRQLPSGRQTFIPVGRLDQACALIRAASVSGDTYVGALPRQQRRGTADAVARGWALWVDLDSRDALERLARFRPLPAIVIRSGSADCAHAWWPLRDPLKPEWVRRANRRLVATLAGDVKSTDAARIMRPAGTLNWKHAPPRPVTCTRVETRAFTLDQVVGGLPDPTSSPRPRAAAAERPLVRGDRLEPLVRTVRDAQPGSRNARLFWAACRAVEHVATGELDDDAAGQALRAAALAAGLSEHEVDRTLVSARAAARGTA